MHVITVASDPSYWGLNYLKKSLERGGYPYTVLIHPFSFGGQMQHIYSWAKQHPGEDFLYTDAYDTVALGGIGEFTDKLPDVDMLVSAEKGCFPVAELREHYPDPRFEWRFVNAGGFYSKCNFFCKLYEETHQDGMNDQAWLSHQFLRGGIAMDYDCKIFQSVAFEGANDFTYGDRITNNFTKEQGIFIHGNGRTNMDKVYAICNRNKSD